MGCRSAISSTEGATKGRDLRIVKGLVSAAVNPRRVNRATISSAALGAEVAEVILKVERKNDKAQRVKR
jgi:hypothetical protein